MAVHALSRDARRNLLRGLPCASLEFHASLRQEFVATIVHGADRVAPGARAAAAGLHAVELRGVLVALRPDGEPRDGFDDEFGLYSDSERARVVRAGGYLARFLEDV